MRARQAKGMSQEDLAGAANIARNYVSRIENGHVSFSMQIFLKIAEALEENPKNLLE